jgi:electron transfer flavoprotein alpha subunit
MVLVYSDDKKLVLELLRPGREISDELGKNTKALIIGKTDEVFAKELISYGADEVIIAETDIDMFKVEEYADLIEKIIKETNEEIILIGSNKNGKELASRLAAKIDAGCIIDCINIYAKDEKLTVERVIYSGNAIAVEQFNSKPQIITVPIKVYEPLKRDENRTGKISKKKFDVGKYSSKVLRIQEMQTGDVNVEEAEIIVSCGRGFKNKEDIKLVQELADVLKGRTVGCSRPIAADMKWLSEDHWIGLSGHKVKPKLYIAAGISGQIQHIAGMRDSRVIVAINKDPEALIFKSADYGIVGDLYEVIPKLTTKIKEKMS